MSNRIDPQIHRALLRGAVIPAHPLALTAQRKLDERRQRALTRYYAAAGATGLAIGVHTTQFQIHNPKTGLLRPVLELAAEETDRADEKRTEPLVRIAGVCGRTDQAAAEAELACELRFHAALVSLAAWKDAASDAQIDHCRTVARIIPLVGFYMQPTVGGRVLPYSFWRRFVEIENVVAIKIAPFSRYRTLDVVRAAAEAGRDDVALYTGNDDNIVIDLLTPFRFTVNARPVERRIVGGLLGQWAVWTRRAVELFEACRRLAIQDSPIPSDMLRLNAQITDANAALFDAAHNFAGCIPGIHEVLRRQGLLRGLWCLNPRETLSPGQREEIDRVCRAYPRLNDDPFVAEHRDEWLSG